MGKIRLGRHPVRDGNDGHARTEGRRGAVLGIFQHQARRRRNFEVFRRSEEQGGIGLDGQIVVPADDGFEIRHDVQLVQPAVHPAMGGAGGYGHGNSFFRQAADEFAGSGQQPGMFQIAYDFLLAERIDFVPVECSSRQFFQMVAGVPVRVTASQALVEQVQRQGMAAGVKYPQP